MPKVVDIRKADDPRDVIHQAVEALAEGRLVAFPTETSYVVGAGCLNESAVESLQALAEPPDEFTFQMAVKGPQAVLDYLPEISRLGRRLTQRCWPGPVSLVFAVPEDGGLLRALPEKSRRCAAGTGRVVFRVPAHPVLLEVLRLMPAPLIVTTDTAGPGRGASTVEEFSDQAEQRVWLILDDGPCRYNQPETIVAVDDEQWRIVRPGIVKDSTLRRLASMIYLFVCTGNTCRSPLAEGLFRKLLAERLKCSEDELPDRGFVVVSAGLAAAPGKPASPEAVTVAAQQGVDLSGHESQPLTDRLLEQADRVLTMTGGHCESILSLRPDLANKVDLLARDGTDIPDPIGFGFEEYRACKLEIERHVRAMLDEMGSEPD